MVRNFTYPVKLDKQKKGGYLVTFPDWPEAITQAESVNDALLEATDCLEEAVANRMVMKLTIPTASQIGKKQHSVSLHASTAAKAALYVTMRNKHLNNVALAKKLDCDEKEVRRLLDPHFKSKIPRIEHALNLLGQRLDISMAHL